MTANRPAHFENRKSFQILNPGHSRGHPGVDPVISQADAFNLHQRGPFGAADLGHLHLDQAVVHNRLYHSRFGFKGHLIRGDA